MKGHEIIILAHFVEKKKVIFNLLSMHGMTLHCCHILLPGNDNLKLNSRNISLKGQDDFQYSSWVKGHDIILLTLFF